MTEKVFVRKASGLVRDISFLDSFIANTCVSGPIGLNIAYGVFWGLFALPGGDFLTAIAVGTFMSLWHVTVYALFSSVYPRSGGDYMFLSRALHPSIGFMASTNFLFFEVIYFGLVLYWFGQITVYAPLAVLGFTFNSPALMSAAQWAASPTGILILGTLLIAFLGIMTTVGVRTLFKLNDSFFILAFVGMLLAIGGLAFSGREMFVANFNSAMGQYTGSANSYEWFIQKAKDLYLVIPPTYDWKMTIGMFAIGTSITQWGFFSSFWGGELKKADSVKTQLALMLGPTIFNGVMTIAAFWVLLRTMGYEFLTSVFYVYWAFPSDYPLPIPPFTNFLMAILYGNPILQFIVAVTFMLWPFVILIPAMMLTSRYLFSWSFDKLAPTFLSKVNYRYRTPIYATIVTCLLFWGTLLVVVFRQDLVWPVMSASSMYIWVGNVALVSITAIFFPWRKKDVYEASPIRNLRIGPMPLISLVGVGAVIMCIINAYLFLAYPSLGLGSWENAVITFIVAAVIGLALYYVAISYRKRQGMPIDLAFKEVPPA